MHPRPGIVPALRLDAAITLPVGVEAYGAYAPAHPARTFARSSAIGSLLLGMLGQVAYHVLSAAHVHRAPWPVVVVSCMPVVTIGFAAALTHLLRSAVPGTEQAAPDTDTRVPEPPASLNWHGHEAAEMFAAELASGAVPSIPAYPA